MIAKRNVRLKSKQEQTIRVLFYKIDLLTILALTLLSQIPFGIAYELWELKNMRNKKRGYNNDRAFLLQATSKMCLTSNDSVASLFKMLTYSPCMLRFFIGYRIVLERGLHF